MRKVNIRKKVFNKETRKYEYVFDYEGIFHEFGKDHEDGGDSLVEYSTGIIETPDGVLHNVYVNLIQFQEPIVLMAEEG